MSLKVKLGTFFMNIGCYLLRDSITEVTFYATKQEFEATLPDHLKPERLSVKEWAEKYKTDGDL